MTSGDRDALRADAAAGRPRLANIIRQKSFSSGGEIKLASGKSSNFYFNMKPTMLDPEGAGLIGILMFDAIADIGADYVGGLEMGAVPIVSTVAPTSHRYGRPLPAFFVRKKAKGHGTQLLIEGVPPGQSLEGKKVAMVEDVTTTGGSVLAAIETVRQAGGEVVCVATIVDRLEGARANLAGHGLELIALFRADEFKD